MSWLRCGSGGAAKPPMITCELVGRSTGYYQQNAVVYYTATEDCLLIASAGGATVQDKALSLGISSSGGTAIGYSVQGASQGPNTAAALRIVKVKAGTSVTFSAGGTSSTANSPYALVVHVIKNIPNLWDD